METASEAASVAPFTVLPLEAPLPAWLGNPGVRTVRVGNPLRSRLTLQRILIQVTGPDAAISFDDDPGRLVDAFIAGTPAGESVALVIGQADTLDPAAVHALKRMAPFFVRDGKATLRVVMVGTASGAMLDGPGADVAADDGSPAPAPSRVKDIIPPVPPVFVGPVQRAAPAAGRADVRAETLVSPRRRRMMVLGAVLLALGVAGGAAVAGLRALFYRDAPQHSAASLAPTAADPPAPAASAVSSPPVSPAALPSFVAPAPASPSVAVTPVPAAPAAEALLPLAVASLPQSPALLPVPPVAAAAPDPYPALRREFDQFLARSGQNAAALLPAASGTLMLPSGKFGCNWTPPTGINLTGQGNGNPSSVGSTILCGVNSLSGNQIAPIQRTNANVTLTNLTLDGGGATDTSYTPLQSYSCLFACYDNSVDTNTFDVFFLGGTTTCWFQDLGCGRPNSSLVRCTNNYGGTTSLAAHGKTQRTITGNGTSIGITTNGTVTITTDAGHPFILPTLAGATLGGDVGRAIVAVGLPMGTYITAVATTTSATVSQPATASASFITATIFQGEAAFLAGTDNQIVELRSTNGTTRLAGGGNQLTIGHFTFTGTSGTMPPNITFETASWSISTLYSDSSPPNASNIVHTVGAKQSSINNLMVYQNSLNANVLITENDTVNSLTISGGNLIDHPGTGLSFTTFLNLAGGSNSSFTCDGPLWASNNSLNKTGSIPNLVTGGTPGRMVFNYSVTGSGPGTLFSIGPVQAGTGLVAGAKLYSGVGAPNIPASGSGDFYFRTDTPLTANQRLYIATAANTWTGIV